jgi:hypothetical protein
MSEELAARISHRFPRQLLRYVGPLHFSTSHIHAVVLRWCGIPTPQSALWRAALPAALTEWERSTGLVHTVNSAAVATDDTVYLPFGFETISTAAERNEFMGRLLDYLLE